VLQLGSPSEDKWPDEWTGIVISRQVDLSKKIAVGYRYVGIPAGEGEENEITGIVYNIAYTNESSDSEEED